jgi:PAS domain S-box-containing protein
MELRQRALGEIGRDALRAATAESFFLEAARIAARTLGADYAGVVQDRSSGLLLQWSTAGSREAAGDEAAFIPRAADSSPWAFAMDSQQPLVIEDAARETRFDDLVLREAAASSGIICPLPYGKRSPGAIGVFGARPREFAEDEVAFLDSVALLLASATARRQAELALADQAHFLATVVDNLDGLVVVLSPTGVVEKFNDACRWMTGLGDHEVLGKPLWESILQSDQADAVGDAFERLRQGEAMARLDAPLRTRDGRDRRVLWTFTIVQREDGRVQAIVASGVEATRRAAADHRLDELNERARKNQEVLTALEQCLREGRTPPQAVLDELLELQNLTEVIFEGNRREFPRKPYPYIQRIAPWSGGRLPPQRTFVEVLCRDISSTGVSFFFPRRPNFDRLVVSLGPTDKKVYVIAEVRHVANINVDGRPAFAVGCQFLARVYY